MTMTPEQLAQLREEVSNPSIGSKGLLRKLVILLLDELEAAQKSNEFLKGQLAGLANFNPDWDMLEASYESWREIAAELLVAKDRITELEARTVTVKLPHRKTPVEFVDEVFGRADLAAIYNCCRLECQVKFKNACAAAGINLTVEG